MQDAAQEVSPLLPHAVTRDIDGRLSLSEGAGALLSRLIAELTHCEEPTSPAETEKPTGGAAP